jgi:hypothetical protein
VLGVLVLGAVAIAVVGIYLLIVGAVALVGWLIAVAAKAQNSASTPHLVTTLATAPTPSAAPPPHHQFHAVLPVDRRVFDAANADALEITAKSIFTAWARQLPSAPGDPSDTIKALTRRDRLIGRLTTKLDGRRFGWRSAPYRSRDRMVGFPTINPASLDPYNPPSDLRTRSSYLSLCESCSGDGKLECHRCGGTVRITCDACNGAGKVDGVTKSGARRLLNCKTCKGKSTLACKACSKGQIDCDACHRSGRVEHWLELEGGPRDGDVQVEPDGDVTKAFAWGTDGVPATEQQITQDARIVCTVSKARLLGFEDLPSEVPNDWINAHWKNIQAQLQPGERVVAQTFTLLEVPSVEVAYALGRDQQSVELEGLRMLAPPASADYLFASRATALRRLMIGLALVPLIVFFAYAIRGVYFMQPALAGVLVSTTAAAAVVYVVLWHATLGRAAKRWLAAAAPPIAIATTLAFIIEPSAASARELINANQIVAAKAELSALGDPADPDLAPLWADVHAKQALAETTCIAATKHIANIPAATPQRAQAQAHADKLALESASAALERRRPDDATMYLKCMSEQSLSNVAGRAVRSRIAIEHGRTCAVAKDWSCVFTQAESAQSLGATNGAANIRSDALTAIKGDIDAAIALAKTEMGLPARVASQQRAIDLWTRYLLSEQGAEPAQLVTLRAAAKKDQDALAKAEQIALQKREAEEKRQAAIAAREERRQAAEEARERRRREAAERASEPQGLLCCDGTLSPSCSCGGSHRGCCSHHGGVCGCR